VADAAGPAGPAFSCPGPWRFARGRAPGCCCWPGCAARCLRAGAARPSCPLGGRRPATHRPL